MQNDANAIAKYIIAKCYSLSNPISNLKLQKMLYFTWVDYYKKTSSTLFYNEICAWQLGPVVPDVYYEYCSYGGRPICNDYYSSISGNDSVILDEIVKNYINVPASILVNKTHRPGSAWDIIFNHGIGNRDTIPFSLIIEKER